MHIEIARPFRDYEGYYNVCIIHNVKLLVSFSMKKFTGIHKWLSVNYKLSLTVFKTAMVQTKLTFQVQLNSLHPKIDPV